MQAAAVWHFLLTTREVFGTASGTVGGGAAMGVKLVPCGDFRGRRCEVWEGEVAPPPGYLEEGLLHSDVGQQN